MRIDWSKVIRQVFPLAMLAMLSSCYLVPGKFVSEMVTHKDRTFSFSYKGEIYFLGLAEMMREHDGPIDETEFTPETCYAAGDDMEERSCTDEELAAQKEDWLRDQEEHQEREKQRAKEMQAAFGDLDLSDPKGVEEFVRRIEQQKGWNSVVHKGDGLFEVDYAISGRLDTDLVFPLFEHMNSIQPFVTTIMRKDGKLRIVAPAFGPAGKGRGGSLAMFTGMARAKSGKDEENPNMPELDGVFTITTDAPILTNNTESGPEGAGALKKLVWKVNKRNDVPPQALLQLNP